MQLRGGTEPPARPPSGRPPVPPIPAAHEALPPEASLLPMLLAAPWLDRGKLPESTPPQLPPQFINYLAVHTRAVAAVGPANLCVGLLAFTAPDLALAPLDRESATLVAETVASRSPGEDTVITTCDAPGGLIQSLGAMLAACGGTVHGLPGPLRLQGPSGKPAARVRGVMAARRARHPGHSHRWPSERPHSGRSTPQACAKHQPSRP